MYKRQVQDEGWYSVIVTNAWGSATSKPPARVTAAIPHAATATAILAGGFVVDFTNLWGGWGYTNTPAVRIKGGGSSGAGAVAVVSNGMVVAIQVLNPGWGYTSTPVVVIAPPFIESPIINIGPLSLVSSTDLAVGTNYQLQCFDGLGWTDAGPSFTATSCTFTQTVSGMASPNAFRLAITPCPTQAYATAQVLNGFVYRIDVMNGGSGYTNKPSVKLSGDGSGAQASVTSVSNGVVMGIQVDNPGSGYTRAPLVVIDPPPANALYPAVTHLVEMQAFRLSPYDEYQLLESSAMPSESWTELLLFTPTSATTTQRVNAEASLGFYRVRYVGSP